MQGIRSGEKSCRRLATIRPRETPSEAVDAQDVYFSQGGVSISCRQVKRPK